MSLGWRYCFDRRKCAQIAALAAAISLAAPGPTSAATGDGQLGGAATTDLGSTTCPSGVGATGVAGNLGTISAFTVIASATVQCRGGVAAVSAMGSYAGPEGSGSTSCGPGEVAVGIVGREGDFIDQLAVRCRNSDLTDAAAAAPSFGGNGGSADGPYDCASGNWLGGLQGSLLELSPDTVFVREVAISCFAPDSDGDGVSNASDNCVAVSNPSQANTNGGSFGDACATAPGDGRLGGPPGIETGSSVCPAGKGVTGISGNLGTISASTIVATAAVQCEGGAAGDGTIGSYAGIEGSGSSGCGPGQVAVGIVGREGDFVDQLALRCRAADLTGGTSSTAAFGGSGGGPDGPYDCGAGQRLVGLDGSMVFGDSLMRHLVIRCATIAPSEQPSSEPATGESATETPTGTAATPTGRRATALAECRRRYKRALERKRTRETLTKPAKQALKKRLEKCRRKASRLPV